MAKKTDKHTFEPYPEELTVEMFEWIIEQEKDPLDIWETKSLQSIPIANLRDSHLAFILDYMNKKPCWRQDQKSRIVDEIMRRKKQDLIANTKSGKLIYGLK